MITACEKHFPDQQRYNGILLLLTPTKTQKLLLFSSISLFKMKRSTKYQAQGKAKQKRKGPQLQQVPPNGENFFKNSRPNNNDI